MPQLSKAFVDGLRTRYRDLQCDLSETASHSVTLDSSTTFSSRSGKSRKALAGKRTTSDSGSKRFSTYGGKRSRSKSLAPDSENAPHLKSPDTSANSKDDPVETKKEGLAAKLLAILSRICPCMKKK